MSQSKSLQGKVIIVTGAGRGIGRDIALLAAAEGAKVLVNDLGGAADGEGGGDMGPAASVVKEITAAGGVAVANGDSVADPVSAEKIIRTAIDTYGRLDCVVNNAGILRDRIFYRMSTVDYEMVNKVHLGGAFYMSRAAAPYFKEQGGGSYVQFTSASGLIGNFGQASYMAAKMGVVGLSKSIALDMQRFNVRSNCVCPFAWSRLTGSIPTETEAERARVEKIKSMGTEKIAPLVAFLASDLSKEVNAQIFGVRRNEIFLFSQPRPIRSVQRAEGWTVQSLAEQMLPAFKPDFYPLDRSSDVFTWDPI
jgi:NAD(P)-dependent dehydrogenase (short-subunit alcohol dehydrogenase family)